MASAKILLTNRSNSSNETEFSFGRFRLMHDGTVLRGEEPVHLPPKELAALKVLLAHAGQVVNRSLLKKELWGDVHVTADSVPRCLSSLRARLEPDHCIQTVYKRGYRLVGHVIHHGARAQATYRLAIMPFSIGQGLEEHLGTAISEEISARLTESGHPRVSILARDSVFTLARRGHSAAQVGAMLHADLVLTGTLRATPSHFRLRAEMVRVEDGTQIWVEDLLLPKDRFATLKSEIIERLSYRLGADFTLSEHGVSKARPEIVRRDAYETFLRGHHEWQSLERHRMIDAAQGLLLATELDENFLSARVDLAHLIVAQELCGYMPPRVAGERMRSLAPNARELARTAPALLPPLGWTIFHVERDVVSAMELFSQSAHLAHDPWITRLRVMLALSLHRFDEAAEWLHAALIIDPYAPWLHACLAWTCHLAGDADQSMSYLHEALRTFPENESTRLYASMILAFHDDAQRAERMADDLVRQTPYSDHALAIHAYALARSHREKESRDLLERLQWLGRERYVSTSFTPAAFLALGDVDSAISELQNADQARCPWFFQMLADPRLNDLHGIPQFEKMRASLEHLEGIDDNLPELPI